VLLVLQQGKIGQVDVDSIVDPLHQIVPTLLDVPFVADDVPPRPTTDTDLHAGSLQHEAMSVTESAAATETAATSSADTEQNIDTDSPKVESANDPESSPEPEESTLDTLSIPDPAPESHTGVEVIPGDSLETEH